MKAGGGKGKGSAFERQVCKRLSLWVSSGKREDLFWRSAMSGGRATVATKSGRNVHQAGDICSVHRDGHALTDHWVIECKHYRALSIGAFCLEGKGPLAQFWTQVQDAAKYKGAPLITSDLHRKGHGRRPMLIAKQNRIPTLAIAPIGAFSSHTHSTVVMRVGVEIVLFDDLLALKFADIGGMS